MQEVYGKMRLKAVTGILLTVLLIGMLTLAFNIQPVKSDWTWTETIYIRADGSVDPDTAPISSVDNITYTLTDNIVGDVPEYSSAIVVERNNTIVDGADYTVQGTGNGTGIRPSEISNVTIKNMEIKAFDQGIILDYSTNSRIVGNTITNNTYTGIHLANAIPDMIVEAGLGNHTISGNNITENNGWGGIFMHYSSNNTISGNNITNNFYGFTLWGSTYTTISGNNITNNEDRGVFFTATSKNNTVSGNKIANNYDGVVLILSPNNTVSGNNITENSNCGIVVNRGNNNKIYHNNFVDNTQQVDPYYTDQANIWDDGYPSGGNYWSNYTGVDVKSGPYQNETGSDGIGDTPHYINAINQDNYPLMQPTYVTYDVTIQAYCYTEGAYVSVSITMDGTPTGFNTPHNFTGLNRTHTFTVPSTNPGGHPFKTWSTGETNTTITVNSSGTYTAYYWTPPVGGVWVPVDKFGLLAPYIALASTILVATAATAIYAKRRKKKQ